MGGTANSTTGKTTTAALDQVKHYKAKVEAHSAAVKTHLASGKALFEEMKKRVDAAIKSQKCSNLSEMKKGVDTVLGALKKSTVDHVAKAKDLGAKNLEAL